MICGIKFGYSEQHEFCACLKMGCIRQITAIWMRKTLVIGFRGGLNLVSDNSIQCLLKSRTNLHRSPKITSLFHGCSIQSK